MTQISLIVLGIIVGCFLLTVLMGAPYVPTRRRDIVQAFDDLYKLTAHDTLVDIGSGDGLVLREAARRGAGAIGYEINPFLAAISWLLNRNYTGITIHMANFWRRQIPTETTIVYTFGESRDIRRMYSWVERQATQLQKPLYFMSYAFMVEGKVPLRSSRQFHLYKIMPLQRNEA